MKLTRLELSGVSLLDQQLGVGVAISGVCGGGPLDSLLLLWGLYKQAGFSIVILDAVQRKNH